MMKRICALLLALALLLSVSAVFAEGSASDTLLVTFNGTEIRENDPTLQYFLSYLMDQVYDPEGTEDKHIAQMYAMHNTLLITLAIQKAGYTEEDFALFHQQAQEEWDAFVDSIMTEQFNITADSSEEDRIAARGDAVALLESYGYNADSYIKEIEIGLPYDNFTNKLAADLKAARPELAASEEEIQQAYNDYAESDKELLRSWIEDYEEIENEVSAYEVFTQEYYYYYGEPYEFYYIPEGYRGITYILLSADDQLIENWLSLSAQLEEASFPSEATDGDGDAEPEEPVTAEMVEAARKAVLDSRKETLDAIKEKLNAGANFSDLIVEYGEDLYMQEESLRNTGYSIHKDSVYWPSAIVSAAASLEKIGDVSEPVITEDGIYILYYLRDVAGGILEMTEEIRENLVYEIESQRVADAVDTQVDTWQAEADVVWTAEGEAWKYDQAAIDAYIAYYDGLDDASEAVPDNEE
jgi:hypothetical protein